VRLQSLATLIEAMNREVQRVEQLLTNQQAESLLAAREAEARSNEAAARAGFASRAARALGSLSREGVVPELDGRRAGAEATSQQAAVRALRLNAARMAAARNTLESQARLRIEQLGSDIARARGDWAGAQASIATLEERIERSRIRAPVEGRLGEASGTLRPGSVVRVGERLGAVIPAGDLRVVAHFAPDVMGRARQGQRGLLRLHAFPWTQFGTVPLRVTSVSDELRNGLVRVELSLEARPPSVPVKHGLTGMVEVEVEQMSPFRLLVRSIGRQLVGPAGRATDGR
jgi:membrane fusion protein (multidrug efflux system)